MKKFSGLNFLSVYLTATLIALLAVSCGSSTNPPAPEPAAASEPAAAPSTDSVAPLPASATSQQLDTAPQPT